VSTTCRCVLLVDGASGRLCCSSSVPISLMLSGGLVQYGAAVELWGSLHPCLLWDTALRHGWCVVQAV